MRRSTSLWSLAALAVAAVVAVACLSATAVSATQSLECQRVWDGPSFNNDILDCLKDQSRIGSQWRYYIFPAICVIIFLFTLIGVPIIFCCRCCCCQTCCTCCITSSNSRRSRCWLWMWTLIAIVWACCVCVLVIFGASLMMDTASSTLDDIRDGPLDYFMQTKTEIITLMTDYSVDPPVEPNLDLSAFDDVDDTFRDKVNLVDDDYFKYFKIARIVTYCVGAVGVVLILCILIFAFCQCGGCYPVCFSALYWFFAIIYALLAVVFTVGMYASGTVCGELTLQYKREPGVFQWYVIPWCEDSFSFASARDEVSTETEEACHSACEALLEHCDNDPTYDSANDGKIFMCGNGITSASQCTNLDMVADTLQTSYVKPILSNALCTDMSGWVYQEKCTPAVCEKRCTDMDSPPIAAQTWSASIMQSAGFASNTSTALSYVMPMMDCNYIIDRLGSALETEKSIQGFVFGKHSDTANCSNLHASMVMLGVGFFVGSLMFLLGIYILHAGSWFWGAKTLGDASLTSSFDEDAEKKPLDGSPSEAGAKGKVDESDETDGHHHEGEVHRDDEVRDGSGDRDHFDEEEESRR